MVRGSRAWCDIVSCLFCSKRTVCAQGAWRQRKNDGGKGLSMKPGREPSGGEITSENDDMSSDKGGERPPRRKSKGSCLKLI